MTGPDPAAIAKGLTGEQVAALAAWLRDPEVTLRAHEKWASKRKDGRLTAGTLRNIGVCFIHASDLASMLERAHLENSHD